jgi:hypothetical protein
MDFRAGSPTSRKDIEIGRLNISSCLTLNKMRWTTVLQIPEGQRYTHPYSLAITAQKALYNEAFAASLPGFHEKMDLLTILMYHCKCLMKAEWR